MVIAYEQQEMIQGDLFYFLKQNGYAAMELQLLLFWVRHPQAKLSLYSIASALDAARINLRNAIRSLIDKGILKEQHNSNGLTTYSLNADEQVHAYIENLGRLNSRELRMIESQLHREVVPV